MQDIQKGISMKVTIDRMQCVSCGSCWEACPALFVQNEKDSFSQIVPEYQEKGDPGASIELPEGMDCAHDAADLCPSSIITVEE
ncbi:ferredoxin [Methanoregula boonei]|uniref:ferredoxin n=1 Tax=Methanoregula boonei TaxID=358766 RepID=UPI00068A75A2|nr:ferredoxin [Methanoregula boonei]